MSESRKKREVEACNMHGYKILDRKLKRERTIYKLRGKWDDNIKMDFMEIEFECVDLIRLAQKRVQ